jgi:hypothetical protein
MSEELVMAYFNVTFLRLLGGTEENDEFMSGYPTPNRDLN